MNVLQDIQKLAVKKKIPSIRPGYTVRVHQKIKEGEKERIQVFEGLIIKMNSGYGADKTFTVRRVVQGIGVEKVFPLYSTNIQKIEVKKKSKVRQAKMYYMRERFGKSARLKETFVSEKEMEESIEELAEKKTEEQSEAPQSKEGEPEKAEATEPPQPEQPKTEPKAEPKPEPKPEEKKE